MKFTNDPKYVPRFTAINGLRYNPYVGMDYGNNDQRILVLAHNIPVKDADYEKDLANKANPTHFADAIDEYAYLKADWTRTFRNFVKGAVGLTEDYGSASSDAIKSKVNAFLSRIAYTNFINGFVNTEGRTNVVIPAHQLADSKRIMADILAILQPTHIICWGKEVFGYLGDMEGFQMTNYQALSLAGFGKATLKNERTGSTIAALKIYHPSMPGFKHRSSEVHGVFKF